MDLWTATLRSILGYSNNKDIVNKDIYMNSALVFLTQPYVIDKCIHTALTSYAFKKLLQILTTGVGQAGAVIGLYFICNMNCR